MIRIAMAISMMLTTIYFLNGCATIKYQATKGEWLQAESREYQELSQDQALKLAEKIFRLCDETDFEFSWREEELIATRKWAIYAILSYMNGVDIWKVKAEEKDGATKITLDLDASSGSFGGGINAGGAVSPHTYNLFWYRLDYLLGKRPDWVTCEQHQKSLRGSGVPIMDGLCGGMVDDKSPT